jgi:hypothetical protein
LKQKNNIKENENNKGLNEKNAKILLKNIFEDEINKEEEVDNLITKIFDESIKEIKNNIEEKKVTTLIENMFKEKFQKEKSFPKSKDKNNTIAFILLKNLLK